MKISPQNKKILIIVSVCVGVVLILITTILSINWVRERTSLGSLTSEDSVSSYPSDDYTYAKLEDSDNQYSLDASNYDEANTESKIRKIGGIEMTVDNLKVSNGLIMEVLEKYEGSVVSSSERGEDNDKTLTITLKIPVEYFEDVYTELQDIDGEVTYASYYTDDVTQQYIDLESRLRNLEATEEQLVGILDTATTVEDTLAVYEQLTSIRSEIEVVTGELKYLDTQVDYSYLTISLSLSDVGKDVTSEQWKPLGVVKNAFSSLVGLGIALIDFLIWVVVFSPIILIAVLVVVLLRKRAKNNK